MNTPIIKISDDQNTITHESGFVSVAVENETCEGCVYDIGYDCAQPNKAYCCNYQRKDKRSVVFIPKP